MAPAQRYAVLFEGRQSLDDGTAWASGHTRSNLLWVADLTRWERALDIQNGGGALTAMWARHFGFTHQLESTRARVASTPPQADARSANTAVARASPRALPYREAAFDCVMWEGAVSEGVPTARHPDASPALREAFAECRRVLRPDGCLYLGVAVAAWRGRPRGAGRILSGLTRIVVRLADTVLRGESQRRMSERAQRLDRLSLPRTLRRLLEQAGFSEVQSFYIDPSYHQPASIIPARRRAVLVYEGRQSATSARLRWWIAWLGLHSLLYGSYMFLAYARESQASPTARRL